MAMILSTWKMFQIKSDSDPNDTPTVGVYLGNGRWNFRPSLMDIIMLRLYMTRFFRNRRVLVDLPESENIVATYADLKSKIHTLGDRTLAECFSQISIEPPVYVVLEPHPTRFYWGTPYMFAKTIKLFFKNPDNAFRFKMIA